MGWLRDDRQSSDQRQSRAHTGLPGIAAAVFLLLFILVGAPFD